MWDVPSMRCFSMVRSILVQLPLSFFSMRLISVHVVHPFSNMDTTATWKKLRFILSYKSGFHMTDSLSIADPAFASRVLTSFSVDASRGDKFVHLFQGATFLVAMAFVWFCFWLKCIYYFFRIYMKAYTTCCFFQTMQQEFGLGGCICQKRYVISVVRICYSFCGLLSTSCLFQCKAIFFH